MRFQPCKPHRAAVLLALAVMVMLPASARSQSAPSARAEAARSSSDQPSFVAASVRLSSPEVLKGLDFLNPAGDAEPPKGGLFSWNVPLPVLLSFAYDLRSSQERREARQTLPKWAQDDWFHVEARAGNNPSRDDVRQMVRSLLEDRFQLAAHLEKRNGQVYALVVAKSGLGLKPHPEGTPCTLSSSKADEKKYPNMHPTYDEAPARCGVFSRDLSSGGEHRLEMLNVTMQHLADSLGLGLPLSVIDATGLAGRYDAVLDFGFDGVPPNAESSDEIGLPPTPVALEKQLGLKLVKRNAPIDTLVIDRIERLSGN